VAKNSFVTEVIMTNRIFYNGNIYTADKNNTVAEAMYIEGDKIKFIGSNKDIEKYEHMADGIIDLNKKTVVPGFIDSHIHLLAYGNSLSQVNLSGCKSINEVMIQKNGLLALDGIKKILIARECSLSMI